MINKLQAARDALAKLKEFTDAEGYNVAISGEDYTPSTDEIYLNELFLFNENSQGLNNEASQIQLPIYQVAINTPKSMGKWKGLEIAGSLAVLFERGSDISSESQKVIVNTVDCGQLMTGTTHNYYVVSIRLTLIS